MSDCKRCDNCGEVFSTDSRRGFVLRTLPASQGWTISTDQTPTHWDFCGWPCVLAFAEKRVTVADRDSLGRTVIRTSSGLRGYFKGTT